MATTENQKRLSLKFGFADHFSLEQNPVFTMSGCHGIIYSGWLLNDDKDRIARVKIKTYGEMLSSTVLGSLFVQNCTIHFLIPKRQAA